MSAPFDDLPSDDMAEVKRHFSILRELNRQVDQNEEIRQIETGLAINDENALAASGFRGLAAGARHESELQKLRAPHLDAIAEILERAVRR